MPRLNYKPRVKKPKEPFYKVQEKRIQTILSLIQANKTISEFKIQRIMKFGPGVHERMMRLVKNNYQDKAEWNKKTRTFQYVGEITQNTSALEEIPIKQKPVNVFHNFNLPSSPPVAINCPFGENDKQFTLK